MFFIYFLIALFFSVRPAYAGIESIIIPNIGPEYCSIAQVDRVIDGDTIVVSCNFKQYKVRAIGIDTPETVHPTKKVECYGKEASQYAKRMLTGEVVRLEYDRVKRDLYGRLLAYVYLGELSINEDLIRNGYARVYLKASFGRKKEYLKLQEEAIAHKNGLWGQCK